MQYKVLATIGKFKGCFGSPDPRGLVQSVEQQSPKLHVARSSRVSPATLGISSVGQSVPLIPERSSVRIRYSQPLWRSSSMDRAADF